MMNKLSEIQNLFYGMFDHQYQQENLQKDKTYKDATNFKLKIKQIKVIKVQDGDTITGGFMQDGEFVKLRMRLAGIDTPEIKSSDPKESEAAKLVRDKLSAKILNKIVFVRIDGFDKQGRPLVHLNVKSERNTLNEWLVEKKYALRQNGGSKKKIDNWLNQINSK